MIEKIISGGQTGVDQAALDFAIKMDIPHGGWIPKGRLTENGPAAQKYRLTETSTESYSERTEKNVIEADGTLIISRGPLTGGSEYTRDMATRHQRPCLHIDLDRLAAFHAATAINEWIIDHKIGILNVAGPRSSKAPRIYRDVLKILESVYYLGLVESKMPGGKASGDHTRSIPGTAAPKPPPTTLAAAVDRLITGLPLKDKTTLANMSAEELPNLYLTLGRYIINAFGLLGGNLELIESCRQSTKGVFEHEEDAVGVIIHALWRKLQDSHKLRVVK